MADVSPAIWPGASTLPGASLIPGQGSHPFVRCRVSFVDASAAVPSWTNVTDNDFRSFAVSRGRESELSDFDVGTATIVLDNRDRSYDPTVNASVRPMNRVWLYAEFSGTSPDLFRGYAESWGQEWPGGGWSDAQVQLSATDEFKVIARQTLPTSGTLPAADPDIRISDILDAIDSSASRFLQEEQGTGTTAQIGATGMVGQDPLEAIRNTVAVAGGGGASPAHDAQFFIAADGTATYLQSGHRSYSPYNASVATFGEETGEFGYVELTVDYSDSFLFNEWAVTREGTSVTSTASDSTSITTYGRRPQSLTLPVQTDGDTAILADSLLAKYKDPMLRMTGIDFEMTDAAVVEGLLALELLDRVTVKRTPPGGGARISQELFIQKISISGTNDGHPLSCTLGVSPL